MYEVVKRKQSMFLVVVQKNPKFLAKFLTVCQKTNDNVCTVKLTLQKKYACHPLVRCMTTHKSMQYLLAKNLAH
jgi:hypothetical protein